MLKNKMSEEKVDSLLSKGLIPIIDLAHAGTEEIPIKSVVNRVAQQLHKAFSERGVALLVNHGITEEKLKTAWSYLDDFVKLPKEVQEKFLRNSETNHGYVGPGVEKFDGKTPELRHAFNICTLNMDELPEEALPGFSEHMADIAKDFKNLAGFVLQALAVSLKLSLNFFTEKHLHMLSDDNENATTLRLLYYPPLIIEDNKCDTIKGQMSYSYQRCAMDKIDLTIMEEQEYKRETDKYTRCGAHADYGTFTLLAQDSEGGLEAQLPNSEKWHRVGHLPGAILINTGEILAAWTSEKYPALPHRVVIPEQVTLRNRGRHSMAFFCHPDNPTQIEPIEMVIDTPSTSETTTKTKKPFKNKIFTAYQHVQRKFKETYAS